MRKKLYRMVNAIDDAEDTLLSKIYDVVMMIAIVASILPLAFKETYTAFVWIDRITVSLFILDYVLRFFVADHLLGRGRKSFVVYPFTPMAIIDLLSILPSLTMLNSGLKLLRIIRLMRAMKVLRAFKFLRYSRSFSMIIRVFKKQKKVLSAVLTMAVGYVLISALVIYNIEPETYETFFDAVYWATISLTTVGYGDIYPVSDIGRVITMISSLFGIAIVALPSGVITAGYLAEMNEEHENNDREE